MRTPNTNNTNNFYNVTATGTSNNNNANTSGIGVLCGFPPEAASERQESNPVNEVKSDP